MAIDFNDLVNARGGSVVSPYDAMAMARRPMGVVPAASIAPQGYADAGNTPVTQATDAGIDPAGMVRRGQAPVVPDDPMAPGDRTDSFSRGVVQGVSEIGQGLRNIKGLGQAVIGDDAGALKTFQGVQADQAFSAARGPAVSNIKDVHDLASAGSYAAGFAGSAVPTVASMLIPGGVVGKVGQKIAEKAVAGAAEKFGAEFAANALAKGATKEAADALGARAAAKITAQGTGAVAKSAEVGHIAGTAAGAFPSTVAGSTDAMLDPGSTDTLRTRAGKVIAGDAVASVIGALPIARLLQRTGVAGAAGEAIAKDTKSFIPRIPMEMVKQAGLQGTLGVAQTAAVLATHKWVNNNMDLMSPQAIDQYINAAAGGALIGGALGGAFEAVHGASPLDSLKTKLSDTVKDYRKTVTPREKKPPVGSPMADEAAPAPDTQDKYEHNFDEASHDADIADQLRKIDSIHQEFLTGKDALVGEVPRKTNPVQLPDPVQNGIASFIPSDHPIWGFPENLNAATEAGAKALRGQKLTPSEKNSLHSFGDVVGHDKVLKMLLAGKQYGDLLSKAKGIDPGEGVAPQAKEGETPVTPAAPAASDEAAPTPPEPEGSQLGIHETPRIPTPELSDRLAAAPLGSPEHADLQSQLRERMIGHRGEDGTGASGKPFETRAGEGKNNVIIGNSKAQLAKTLKRGFLIDDPEHKAPVAVDIGNLVRKKLADRPGSDISALHDVMADMTLAGIKVQPESIRPGIEFAPNRKLSPNEAKSLRTESAGHVPRETTPNRFTGKTYKEGNLKQDKAHARTLALEERDAEKNNPAEIRGHEGDFDTEPDTALATRARPPTGQGTGVAQVDFESPHAKTLAEHAVLAKDARTPASHAALRRATGAKIGQVELAKLHADGQISDRRYAAKVAELHDPNSGLSRRYFRQAVEGKFDRARVREAKSDTEAPLPKEATRDELAAHTDKGARVVMQERMAKGVDAEKLQKQLSRNTISETTKRDLAESIVDKAKPTKAERAYLALARDAGYLESPEAAHGAFGKESTTAEHLPKEVDRSGSRKDPNYKTGSRDIEANKEVAKAEIAAEKARAEALDKQSVKIPVERHTAKAPKGKELPGKTYNDLLRERDAPREEANLEAESLHKDLGREGFAATHDSPTKHAGDFDWRKHEMTGEGANTYGAGTYLSTDELVHRGYKAQFTRQLAFRNSTKENFQAIKSWAGDSADYLASFISRVRNRTEAGASGETIRAHTIALLKNLMGDEGERSSLRDAEKRDGKFKTALHLIENAPKDAFDYIDDKTSPKSPSYRVSVDAKSHEIMDWNKPLHEQPPKVRQAAEAAMRKAGNHLVGVFTGQDIYRALRNRLGSDRAASEALQAEGLVGHKYAAAGGRNEEHPNYVIYDDKRIKTNYVSLDEAQMSEGVKSIHDTESPHDLAKETRMGNAVLKAAGVKSEITFKMLTDKMRGVTGIKSAGRYVPGEKTAYISAVLKGAERMGVILHELGHHIIRATIGTELEHATPELRDAINADYDKWRAENDKPGRLVSEVLASKKGIARAERIALNSDLSTVSELLAKHGEIAHKYLFDREEWIADHISRALSDQEASRTVIGRFFKNVADKLKAAYDGLFGGDRERFKTAPSVDAWVKSLFDAETRRVSEAANRPVSKPEAQVHVKVATEAANDSSHTPPPAKGGGGGGGAYDAAAGGFRAFAQFMRYSMNANERRIWRWALDRRVIEKQIRAKYKDNEFFMKGLDTTNRRYETLAYLAYKMHAAGELKLGPHFSEVAFGVATLLRRVAGVAGNTEFALRQFEDITNGKLKATKAAGNTYDVRKSFENGPRAAAQHAYNQGRELWWHTIYTPMRKLLWDPSDKLHSGDTPALSKIGALIKLHGGEGGRNGQVGILNVTHIRQQEFIDKALKAVEGLDGPQKLAMQRALQEQIPLDPANPVHKAALAMQDLYREGAAYAKAAGIPMGEIKDYYPVVMDGNEVRTREGDFRRLMNQPHFDTPIRELFSQKGKPSTLPKNELVDKLFDYASRSTPESQLGVPVMDFRARNPRLMEFIYKHAQGDDKKTFASFQTHDPERVIRPYFDQLVKTAEWSRRFGFRNEKWNKLIDMARKQNADEDDIATAELYGSVLRGEYAREGSPVLTKLFGQGFANKVTGDKMKTAISYMLAYQNLRTLPLTLLSSLVDPMGIFIRTGGDFGAAFGAFKTGMGAIMKTGKSQQIRDLYDAVHQADDYVVTDNLSSGYGAGLSNFATLPRKISDTMFRWNGLTAFTKATRYMALAAGQRFLIKHQMGGNETSKRYMRELGVRPGDVQHQNGHIKLLTDQQRAAASKSELARDDRVHTALNRFVDEAILRTDASQRPLWFNDPYMGLVTQYKSFAYAFDAQIISRIKHELHYSNFKILAPAAAYFPITMMGEMLRAGIQYGPGGNPQQQSWGPGEYAAFISRRTGLLGPRLQFAVDSAESKGYSNMGRMLELGPTIEQGVNFGSAAMGTRSMGKAIVDAAPGSALYKHWSL